MLRTQCRDIGVQSAMLGAPFRVGFSGKVRIKFGPAPVAYAADQQDDQDDGQRVQDACKRTADSLVHAD